MATKRYEEEAARLGEGWVRYRCMCVALRLYKEPVWTADR